MEISTVTETVTVTKYSLILTEAELTAALVDPAALQQTLRDARAGVTRVNGNGKHNLTLVRRGRKPAKETPASRPKGPAGKGGFAKSPCPECRQMVAGSQMKTHRMRKHGVPDAKSSESN